MRENISGAHSFHPPSHDSAMLGVTASALQPETVVVTELVCDILPDHQTRQLELRSLLYFVFNTMSQWIPLQVPA